MDPPTDGTVGTVDPPTDGTVGTVATPILNSRRKRRDTGESREVLRVTGERMSEQQFSEAWREGQSKVQSLSLSLSLSLSTTNNSQCHTHVVFSAVWGWCAGDGGGV